MSIGFATCHTFQALTSRKVILTPLFLEHIYYVFPEGFFRMFLYFADSTRSSETMADGFRSCGEDEMS